MTWPRLSSDRYLSTTAVIVGFLLVLGSALSAAFGVHFIRSAPALLLFTYFVVHSVATRRNVELTLFHWASLALMLLLLVGLLHSRSPVNGAVKLLLMSISWGLFSVALFNVFRTQRLVHLFLVGIGVGGIAYVLILWFSEGHPFGILASANLFFRLSLGDTGNPIWLARGMGVSILIMVWYLTDRPLGRLSFVAVPAIPVMFAYMLATGSKAPIVGVVLAAVVFAFARGGTKTRVTTIAMLVLVVLVISSVAPMFSEEDIVGGRILGTVASSLGRRIESWELALDGFGRGSVLNMVFGNGTGAFSRLTTSADVRSYPHNILIEVLYEGGVIGLALLMVVIATPILVLRDRLRGASVERGKNWRGLAATAMAIYAFGLPNA
ncbi:O-antigen ligase family protein, partial [bacterium]|nr:O-antigen ligase family protein [bacterium]